MKAIETKYFGPTNCKGSRIKATDSGGNTVIVSYDYGTNTPHHEAARALCKKMGWGGRLICGGTKIGNVYVFDPAVKADAPLKIVD